MDAGAGPYTDSTGLTWAADRKYVRGSFGYTNKNAPVLSTNQPITGTVDDALYQTQRQDPTEYVFDGLPSGVYEVELRFVEIQTRDAIPGSTT